MKPIRRYISLPGTVLLGGLLWMVACEKEVQPDSNPTTPGNPVTIDPDKIMEYLAFTDAGKITGNLPAAPDGQLKITVKDTIFLPRGFPVGERLAVIHNGIYDISGFYIAVENSSFYYDIPVVASEAQDSSDAFYLDLEETGSFDWKEFPLIILPYGPGGSPLDKFIRTVKIETPGEDTDGFTVPANYSLDLVHWEWIYTVNVNPDDPVSPGEVLHFEGKGVKKFSEYQTGGCCNDNGTSSTVANDPYCFSKFSNGTPNPRWRSIDVAHYFMWAYDILYLYDNGTFRQANTSVQTNYRPSKSDFCKKEAAYDFDVGTFIKSGTHDFTPGASRIKFTYTPSNPPIFGKNIYGGNLWYTSHSMLIEIGRNGGTWYAYYKRPVNGVSTPATLSLEGWD
jgi:hypothetical protein